MVKAASKAKKAPAKSKPPAKQPVKKASVRARKPLAKPSVKPAAKPVAKTSVKSPAAKPATAAANKWVFTFGDGKAEGKADMRDLLGGKGANLAEMANLGLPVPPGFTIPTSVCTYFYANDKSYPPELKRQVEKELDNAGKLTAKPFGAPKNPWLV